MRSAHRGISKRAVRATLTKGYTPFANVTPLCPLSASS